MKSLRILFSSLVVLVCLTTTAWSAEPAAQPPTVPPPPQLDAKGYLLIDFNSGRTLADVNGDERLEPASLTKIMTAYVVFRELAEGRIHLDDKVTVSEKAWRTGGSRMFIELHSEVSVENLIKGMIIQSGNDASVALAEYIAGSTDAFANLMNTQARRLGMLHSHFVNPTGLPDPNHYTTPHDIARVAMAVIRDFPQYYKWESLKEFTYNGITQANRNPLLRLDSSADGFKTGHTESAGYCLVGSAKRDGMRLISVLMGAPSATSRGEESLALLNYGFRFYESHELYPANRPVENLRVWYGEQETLPVGPTSDVYATIPLGRYSNVSAHLERTAELKAPIAKGARIGDLVVKLGDQELTRVPVVALQDMPKGGIWRTTKDTVMHMFSGN